MDHNDYDSSYKIIVGIITVTLKAEGVTALKSAQTFHCTVIIN